MSHKIGIVGEGVSDYLILKQIVERYLRDVDVYTIPLKPKIKHKGKQDGYGTWQGVFDYISGSDQLILEAISEGCRYVIIQIDTDVCESYDLKKDITDLPAFYNSVKDKLASCVHPDFDIDKAIFAVCIHEIECWLIPFVSSDIAKCTNVDRCLNILNRNVRTIGVIDKENKHCDAAVAVYEKILKNKKKAKDIYAVAQFNYGFQKFIEQLDYIKERLISAEVAYTDTEN